MCTTLRFLLAALGALAIFAGLEPRGTATARAGTLTLVTESSPSSSLLPSPWPHDHDSRMPFSDQETIRKTFDLGAAGASRRLEVDNVTGSIEVVGADSTQVQLVVHRTNRAKAQEKLEEAKKEVKLEITQEAGALKIYVDGPFRCRRDGRQSRDGCCCVSFRGDEEYSVHMDFQLQVPRDIHVTLRTVNDGEIAVRDVRGRYSVHNVNGGIEMLRIAGSGEAQTVNGDVKVTFRENPRENSSFESVNGDIDLHFVSGLSADFRFKTFNGDVFSDFPVASLPARGMEQERKGGKTIFRADRFAGGRIGSGGIQVTVENLNGDIRIRENHE